MCKRWRIGALLVAVVAAIIIGGAATISARRLDCFAGGTSNFYGFEEQNWSVRIVANSYWIGDCPSGLRTDTNAYINGWLSGAGISCYWGSYAGGGVCHDDCTGGQCESWVDLRSQICGTQLLRAEHFYIDNGTPNSTFHSAQRTGASCISGEEECALAGGTWDSYEGMCWYSPILIPLTRSQDWKLVGAKKGVKFDINGDGVIDQTGWTAPDSRLAFLALDRDGDGRITSGKELIGNATEEQKGNGFELLSALEPGVHAIDESTELYSKLLLWEDRNHNGVSEPEELQPASNVVSEIGVSYLPHNRRDGNGNRFAYMGYAFVRTAPGRNTPKDHAEQVARHIQIYDVFFGVVR